MKMRKPLTRKDFLTMMLSTLKKDVYSTLRKNNGRLTAKQIEALCKYRKASAAVNEDSREAHTDK
jgi:hypothetical protein